MPTESAASDDRDYDLRVREIALRLTVERSKDRHDIDINKCFAWFERLLRGPER